MNVTLKQLQVFRAVARYENLGLAAEQLFITKGAVSQALQEMEKQLGLQLFDRVHPRLYINHEGQRLLPLADEMLQRAEEIARTFSHDQGDHFLAVGCSKTIGNYILPEMIKGFEDACRWLPDLYIANTKKLCQRVAGFSLDLALLEGEERHPDLIFEPWLADHMVVVAHKNHPLGDHEAHSIKALAGERWVLREPESGSRDYFDHKMAPLLPSYSIALTLSSPESIIGVVAEGLGLAFTSKLSVEQSSFAHRLKIIPLDHDFPRTFSVCYHSKKYHSASMRRFLDYCRPWQPGAHGAYLR